MRRWAALAASAVCLASAVFFGVFGMFEWQKGEEGFRGTSLAAWKSSVSADGEAGAITAAEAKAIRETENARESPMDFTAWREDAGAVVTDEDGGRSTEVTLVSLCGSSELLISYGTVLQESDTSGCLIGEQAAEELFQTREAEGLTVVCGGKSLTIRGVLSEPENVLVCQETKEDGVFFRAVLQTAGSGGLTTGQSARAAAEAFLGRHGLDGMIIEKTNESPFSALLELVPGKWSDFPGWKENLAEAVNTKRKAEALPESIFERGTSEHKKTAAAAFVCCAAAAVLAMRLTDGKSRKAAVKNS